MEQRHTHELMNGCHYEAVPPMLLTMRLLMTIDTGDLDRAALEGVFKNIGWGVANDELGQRKLREIVESYPNTVSELMQGAPQFVINRTARIWGTVSMENPKRANVRLVAETPSALREGAEALVERLSGTFSFDPSEVVIRRQDSEIELQKGSIEHVAGLGWVQYLKALRRREGKLIVVTVLGFAICLIAGAVMFAFKDGDHTSNWAYARQAVDRISTAFLIAAVTTVINSLFEYNEWRSANYRIKWGV
ncbi:hypothetical protein ACWGI8_11635 [Streptomyces sp. NPDC054841]